MSPATVRRSRVKPIDHESESADLLKSIEEYELEFSNLEMSIDEQNPEPREELVETSEREPTMSGRRYPLRERKAPTTYASQYILLTDDGESERYKEAMADESREKWLNAMQEEIESLHANYTYDLVELSKGKRALMNKWVYKVKIGEVDNEPR